MLRRGGRLTARDDAYRHRKGCASPRLTTGGQGLISDAVHLCPYRPGEAVRNGGWQLGRRGLVLMLCSEIPPDAGRAVIHRRWAGCAEAASR